MDGRRFAIGGVLFGSVALAAPFTAEDVEAVCERWREEIRYEVSLSESARQGGEWQVRPSPAGSLWLWAYYRADGWGKIPPTVDPRPRSAQEREWMAWIEARIAYDHELARAEADRRNGKPGPASSPVPPGPIPVGLLYRVGEPPPFAVVVRAHEHRVRFEDGHEVVLVDHPAVRPKFPYLRSLHGVLFGGTPVSRLPREELDALFDSAGIPASARRVMEAVSFLEGGFDAVNTYDTGWVSVGFIQFAALREAGGSLGRVLLRWRRDDPESFRQEMLRYGVGVTDDGKLACVRLDRGDWVAGPPAADAIIADKRLTAVFVRAGRVSQAFRLAQLRQAYEEYYPGHQRVEITIAGRRQAVEVRELIRSEAAMAVLMDRLVNTGRLDPLAGTLQDLIDSYGLTSASQLADFERHVAQRLRYRKDYLVDASLSQPERAGDAASRSGGSRTGRPRP